MKEVTVRNNIIWVCIELYIIYMQEKISLSFNKNEKISDKNTI